MKQKKVRMVTSTGPAKVKQQHTKEHEVLTKSAWKGKRSRKH